jgi:hypothetical protein
LQQPEFRLSVGLGLLAAAGSDAFAGAALLIFAPLYVAIGGVVLAIALAPFVLAWTPVRRVTRR